ncbi:MAG: hypothetical protein M5U34_48080 [Chloroflexi bacterium]|nr:hypothetical protein [Chloroflexota bacterium]
MNILATINYDTVGGRRNIPRAIRLFAPNLNFFALRPVGAVL